MKRYNVGLLLALAIMPVLFSMKRRDSLGADEWSPAHEAFLLENLKKQDREVFEKKRKKLSNEISFKVLQQMADQMASADDEPEVILKDVPFEDDQPGDESLPTSGESSEFPSKELGPLRTPSRELDVEKLAQWEMEDGNGKGGRAGRQARVKKALDDSY